MYPVGITCSKQPIHAYSINICAYIALQRAHIVPLDDHIGIIQFIGVVRESLAIVC